MTNDMPFEDGIDMLLDGIVDGVRMRMALEQIHEESLKRDSNNEYLLSLPKSYGVFLGCPVA